MPEGSRFRRKQVIETHDIARVDIEEWERRYPVAARELAEWARDFPDAMARMSAWDEAQSDQVEDFTQWAADNRYDVVGLFIAMHPSWEWLGGIARDEAGRAGLEAYVAWARRNTEAALELVFHPKGLRWAERNVVRPLTGRAR